MISTDNAHSLSCTASINSLLAVIIILTFLSGCSPKPTKLPIKLMWGDQVLNCHQALPELPLWQLDNIQFYLSDFNNNGQAIALVEKGHDTQQKNLALLGSDCQSDGRWQLHFEQALQPGEFSFNLGVPFELNHQALLTSASPLNQSDMFWTWQLGYKFFRLDLATEQQQNDKLQTGWQFHLGSTGCQSASVMRAPAEECAYPNRPRFTLHYQGEASLVLDLAPLLSEVLQNQEITQDSCMSDPNTLIYKELLPKIGVNGTAQIWRWQS
ncbi:metallo-mystery pair system four-Cys motif protein [Shewanella sp. D64]|uniref:MbnP family protein n=1 Tax=unclassified Shewanella TaxID=196818 RepID=UPI0022BA5690|nr:MULTISPECIES: MbnP family protein [unclassified Shewanella]MEC4727160.1 metallo-mystery pair system four-Cys motif protein [Shewanella sp. D64]MEC4739223.1 metallo-mystery pair system four-Cys motif protein [Shewanella sp. E94]WBJ95563.1 metallo-mystery pair system four-Cys motif protein [Shewanella sp. MTB7]